MPEINRSALVRYSAAQMYQLVNDVPSYPQFLPGCVASQVLEQREGEMLASLTVKKAGLTQAFTTRNTLITDSAVTMALESGPFKQLQGNWRFQPLRADACKVELSLDFEFSNTLVEAAFGRVFNELAMNMVQSFSNRAKEVYRG